jgi:hypothetical protein
MKCSRALSRVKLLKNQHFEDHLCPHPQGDDMDVISYIYLSTLRMRTEMVFETLVFYRSTT